MPVFNSRLSYESTLGGFRRAHYPAIIKLMVDGRHIGERIRAVRQSRKDITARQIALACEVSDKAVYKWEKTGQVSREHLSALSRVLNVPVDWLLYGDEPSDKRPKSRGPLPGVSAPSSEAEHTNVCPGPEAARPVPVISWVQAGHWHEAVDLYPPGDAEAWRHTTKNVGESAFYLRVEGDSMMAPYGRGYPPGCLILVDPDTAPDPGRRVVARHVETCEVTFKELAYDAGQYYLKPLNPQYETLRTDSEWEVVGVVRETIIQED